LNVHVTIGKMRVCCVRKSTPVTFIGFVAIDTINAVLDVSSNRILEILTRDNFPGFKVDFYAKTSFSLTMQLMMR